MMFIYIDAIISVLSSVVFVYTQKLNLFLIIPLFFAFFIGMVVLLLLFLFVVSLFMQNKKPIKKDNMLCRFLAYLVMDIIVTVGNIDLKVTGEDIIPTDRPFVLIQNHKSMFDPLVTYIALCKKGVKLSFISKPENMKIPVAGKIVYNCGFLPVNRTNPREAIKSINTAVKYINELKIPIAIYPEGTRNRGDGLLGFKHGAFKMAQKAQVDILVTSVNNTSLVKKNMPFKKTKVNLDFIKIIPSEEVKNLSTSEMAEATSKIISEKLNEY